MEVHNIIDMSNWKTLDTIITELHINGVTIDRRALRNTFANNNLSFNKHETDVYIAHGNKGYKATTSTTEIVISNSDLYTRAIDMLKKYYGTQKAINENYNLRADLESDRII